MPDSKQEPTINTIKQMLAVGLRTMAGVLEMTDDYDKRVIGRYDCPDSEDFYISTARVADGAQPIETAIAHPEYNGGKLVIVEAYNDKKAAKAGHKKWVALMTGDALPSELVGCANSEIAKVIESMDGTLRFPRQAVSNA